MCVPRTLTNVYQMFMFCPVYLCFLQFLCLWVLSECACAIVFVLACLVIVFVMIVFKCICICVWVFVYLCAFVRLLLPSKPQPLAQLSLRHLSLPRTNHQTLHRENLQLCFGAHKHTLTERKSEHVHNCKAKTHGCPAYKSPSIHRAERNPPSPSRKTAWEIFYTRTIHVFCHLPAMCSTEC